VIFEFLVLGILASLGNKVLLIVLPYSLTYTIASLIAGLSGTLSAMSRYSGWLTLPLLSYLLIDVPSFYLINSNLSLAQSSYLAHVLGLASPYSQHFPLDVFLMKLALLLLSFSKLSYPHSLT
jgi:putative Ca2+/H+ antiporter (TMEM165/GDT1 family)